MTENELKAIEQRVEGWSRYSPDADATEVAEDMRALLLEVRRVSPVVAAAMSLYDRQMYGNLPIITQQSPLFVACRKAMEGQP